MKLFASLSLKLGRGRSRLLLCLLPLLAACGGSQFAYLDEGRGMSISVVREQPYLGGPWNSVLIVAMNSRCQRRYPLEGMNDDGFQFKVYRPQVGVYVLNSGTRWFATDLQTCEFQPYKTPPPFPGDLVGRFEVRNKTLEFIPDKPAKR